LLVVINAQPLWFNFTFEKNAVGVNISNVVILREPDIAGNPFTFAL